MKKEDIITTNKHINKLAQFAERNRHRYLVVLEGEYEWAIQICMYYLLEKEQKDTLLISDNLSSTFLTVSNNKVENYLGNEFDYVIYDVFSGLIPNSICQAEGLLKGGGLFFLIKPPLTDWLKRTDQFDQKYAMYPYDDTDMLNLFISRFNSKINLSKTVSRITQTENNIFYAPQHTKYNSLDDAVKQFTCKSQDNAIEDIVHVATGHRNRPLAILANRGRGKSAALGISCARLLQHENKCRIIITAPRKTATDIVFKHLRKSLSKPIEDNNYYIEHNGSTVEFIAPDELLSNHVDCTLLMIDEASSIPSPILESLLTNYHRIIFTTTVYGYEGNGRGFELKFIKKMKEMRPGSTVISIEDPIRWNKSDELEELFFQLFLLKTDNVISDYTELDFNKLKLTKINKEKLVKDEALLRNIYGILINAHYKTTPNDLRMIMDCPYVSIYVLEHKDLIIAASLIVTEGNLQTETSNGIHAGDRRLKGHYLPQSLIHEFGMPENGLLKYARILRIAVCNDYQNQGVGSFVLKELQSVLQNDYDMLGAVFGCDNRLLKFWNNNDFTLIKLGHKRNAYSGLHSAVVLKSLSHQAELVIEDVKPGYFNSFLFALTDRLKHLDYQLIIQVLSSNRHFLDIKLSDQDLNDLKSFANTNRQYNACEYKLYKLYLACYQFNVFSKVDDIALKIMTQRLMQRLTEDEVVKNCNLIGKNELLIKLRESVGVLITSIT